MGVNLLFDKNRDFPGLSIWFSRSVFSYLLVDICPIVDQQLQTEGTVGGDSSQVQGGVAALVGLVNVGAVVDQLSGHCLLAHVARHMEWSVSKSVGLVDLRAKQQGGPKGQRVTEQRACIVPAKRSRTSAPILNRYFTISMWPLAAAAWRGV